MNDNKKNLPATIQKTLENISVIDRIEKRLGEKAGAFITTVLDLCGEDKNLALCDPNAVIKECLKSAGLDLPINKNLGFAFIIAYNESKKGSNGWVETMTPHFQMGYKGFIQLAIRTGQYRHLNADAIYEGETVFVDKIKGTLEMKGEKTSDTVIGYFSYMELLNGFSKGVFWTVEKAKKHGQTYSKSWNPKDNKFRKNSTWDTNFDSMAIKSVLLNLLGKYGVMSIDMSDAMKKDSKSDFKGFDTTQDEIDQSANSDIIDIEQGKKEEIPTDNTGLSNEDKKEIQEQEQKDSKKKSGPGSW